MTNEVVQTQTEKTEVSKQTDISAEFVKKLQDSWAMVLPKICTPERFSRVALSCIKKNEKLLDAVKTKEGRMSLAEQFMKCAELGIEPDGRRAYLIPYKDNKTNEYTINLIIDYKGIAELAMRSGYISNIHADKVCENDDFEYNMGAVVKHKIDFKGDRGNPYAYYSIVTFKDGTKKCEVMSKDEIDKIKERSSAWGAWQRFKKVCPWNTDYDEMAKKTVFKRLAKWIPQSPEMQKAIELDDEDYTRKAQVIDNPMNDISAEDRYKAVDFNPETGEIIEENEENTTN